MTDSRPAMSLAEFIEVCTDNPYGTSANAASGWFIDKNDRRLDYEIVVTHIDGKQVSRQWKPWNGSWWKFWA